MDDFYKVTVDDIHNNGGRGVLHYYSGSPSKALHNVYPQHPWNLERFKNRPQRSWNSIENQRIFFDWSQGKLGYKCMEDWYRVTADDIHKNGGGGLLLQHYGNSPSSALQGIYAEHNWMLWKFIDVDYLERMNGIKTFIKWLSVQLRIQDGGDWYNVGWDEVYKRGGLLGYSSNSPFEEIKDIHPNHEWMVSKFHLTNIYWDKVNNLLEFFNWMGLQLECYTLVDWYNVREDDVKIITGQSTFNYLPAIAKVLQWVYPEHIWKFKQSPLGYFTTRLDWLSEKLSIQRLDDWYRISMVQVQKFAHIQADELSTMLKNAYPNHQWNSQLLGKRGHLIKASQRELLLAVKSLFPTHSNGLVYSINVVRSGRRFSTLLYGSLDRTQYGVRCVHRRPQTRV